MSSMASQITSLAIVYSSVYSGADKRKHRWPVNSPHKGPLTRKCFHLMTSSWLFIVAMPPLSCLLSSLCLGTSSWWRHPMETFSASLALCAGNSPVTGEFPSQRPVTRSFDVFFDRGLNKRLSKQSRNWWFETPSCLLWRHRNVLNSKRKVLVPKCYTAIDFNLIK